MGSFALASSIQMPKQTTMAFLFHFDLKFFISFLKKGRNRMNMNLKLKQNVDMNSLSLLSLLMTTTMMMMKWQ